MSKTDAEWRNWLTERKLPPAPEGVVTNVRWIARHDDWYVRVGAPVVLARPARRSVEANFVRAMMEPMSRYLNVISTGPLMILRLPEPEPSWRQVLKAFAPVKRGHKLRWKDVFALEQPHADMADRLDGVFVLVRGAT